MFKGFGLSAEIRMLKLKPGLPVVIFLLVATTFIVGCQTSQPHSRNTPADQQNPAGDVTTENKEAIATQNGATGCNPGDCMNGTGTYRFANGDVYAGGFRDGLRDGAGTYRFANGDVLNTTFQKGRPAGSGSYIFQDGRVFRGEFSNTTANLTGKGLLTEKSASRFCILRGRDLSCDNNADPINTISDERPQSHLLMLFASDSCRIVRGQRVLPGGAGVPLYPGDRIESTSESAELQGRGGIAIRLRPHSVLEIPEGTQDQGGILYLRKGGVAVDYQGDPDKIPFRINANNTNFDVEGTTFMVEVDDAKGTAKVRVFEGTVSVSPSLPALEKLDVPAAGAGSGDAESRKSEGGLSDPELQKIAEAISKQAIKVQANQEGELSEAARESAKQLNKAIETTVEEREKNPSADTERTTSPQLEQATNQLETSAASAPETFEASPQENAELKLLITIDAGTFEAATRSTEGSGEPDATNQDSVRKAYEKRLDTKATALEKELASDQSIKTQADLIKRYKFLEVVMFNDGKQKAGSIAAQAGSILIMHAPDGVFRLSREDVKQIDFYDVVADE